MLSRRSVCRCPAAVLTTMVVAGALFICGTVANGQAPRKSDTVYVPPLSGPQPQCPVFFGIPLKGKRFVFVMDASASMSRRVGGQTLMQLVTAELRSALANLDGSQEFSVVMFRDNTFSF